MGRSNSCELSWLSSLGITSKWTGIVALMALNILNNFQFKTRDVDCIHTQMEALKWLCGCQRICDRSKMYGNACS